MSYDDTLHDLVYREALHDRYENPPVVDGPEDRLPLTPRPRPLSEPQVASDDH